MLLTACAAPGAQPAAPDAPEPEQTWADSRPAAPAGRASVALRVLVLDDGQSWAAALQQQMLREGLPYDLVTLQAADRALITAETLAGSDADSADGHYSAIVAPGFDSPLLTPAEQQLLVDYQARFGVRLVDTTWDDINTDPEPVEPAPIDEDNPAPPPPPPPPPFYEGHINGGTATVTPAGLAGSFSYLRDTVRMDEGGEETTALLVENPTLGSGGLFTPLVTMPIPGTPVQGSLIGEENLHGRERLILAFDADDHQQTTLLAHGILRWATRDISLSHFRSWFSVHADDILLPNAEWSVAGSCEIGRNCPDSIPTTGPDATVRMVPDDVDALVAWQKNSGVRIDMAFNGAGAAEYAAKHGGIDPLTDRLVDRTEELRWISHTFTHTFLGCERVLEPDSWRCRTDAQGDIQWVSREVLAREVVSNQRFMAKQGLENYSADELVTGEHSGLRKPPMQPSDNPELAGVLTRAGIRWIASDASDERAPRAIGSATTVPRHPIDLDYNTPTARQVVSLFNWKHTSKADGGSGRCERTPDDPCVAPLPLDTGFTDSILPTEAEKIFQHMITDDARPHFVHQANLTDERLLYPVLDAALERRAAVYADNVPLLNPSMSQAGAAMVERDDWTRDYPLIDATVSGQRVKLVNRGDRVVRVPVSLPEGAADIAADKAIGPFGEAYAGQRSTWVEVAPGEHIEFEIPGSGFAADAAWPPAGV